LRLPVVAVVELLVTRSVTRVWSSRRGHSLLDASASNDSVYMCRDGPGTDDGINSLDRQRLAVDRKDLAMGETDQRQAEGRKQSRDEGRHDEINNWPEPRNAYREGMKTVEYIF
jgi:hypothetical protein